jgi:hypothetical protein
MSKRKIQGLWSPGNELPRREKEESIAYEEREGRLSPMARRGFFAEVESKRLVGGRVVPMSGMF